jgi:hypothetical protein
LAEVRQPVVRQAHEDERRAPGPVGALRGHAHADGSRADRQQDLGHAPVAMGSLLGLGRRLRRGGRACACCGPMRQSSSPTPRPGLPYTRPAGGRLRPVGTRVGAHRGGDGPNRPDPCSGGSSSVGRAAAFQVSRSRALCSDLGDPRTDRPAGVGSGAADHRAITGRQRTTDSCVEAFLEPHAGARPDVHAEGV